MIGSIPLVTIIGRRGKVPTGIKHFPTITFAKNLKKRWGKNIVATLHLYGKTLYISQDRQNRPITIGSGADCDIRIKDPNIAPKQLEIRVVGDREHASVGLHLIRYGGRTAIGNTETQQALIFEGLATEPPIFINANRTIVLEISGDRQCVIDLKIVEAKSQIFRGALAGLLARKPAGLLIEPASDQIPTAPAPSDATQAVARADQATAIERAENFWRDYKKSENLPLRRKYNGIIAIGLVGAGLGFFAAMLGSAAASLYLAIILPTVGGIATVIGLVVALYYQVKKSHFDNQQKQLLKSFQKTLQQLSFSDSKRVLEKLPRRAKMLLVYGFFDKAQQNISSEDLFIQRAFMDFLQTFKSKEIAQLLMFFPEERERILRILSQRDSARIDGIRAEVARLIDQHAEQKALPEPTASKVSPRQTERDI
ncbi:MAG: FHA domain-containing protein [Candidatus Saganbacteria bacterium]|nr:FHA domain-containing protein [Candidatus Saganbacteria bacterium]